MAGAFFAGVFVAGAVADVASAAGASSVIVEAAVFFEAVTQFLLPAGRGAGRPSRAFGGSELGSRPRGGRSRGVTEAEVA
ncbi:hypothetical protein GCM10027268_18430 [Brachybacterium huguangmaarense]